MKVTFLGQGLESESKDAVGHYLIKYLNNNEFHSFTAISAFVSRFVIQGLTKDIIKAKQNFKNITIIVGIDQEGTSKEALEEILNLNVNSYIFYQSESVIFHSKIYLFEGENEVKLIIGSSNLTGNGLFRNVESSLLVEYSNGDKDGEKLLKELKSYYSNLLDFTDLNLIKISFDIIKEFALKGIIPNEEIIKEKYSKKTNSLNNVLTIDIHKRSIAKIPSTFKQTLQPEYAVLDMNIEHLLKKVPTEIVEIFYILKDNLHAFDENIEINVTHNYIGFKTSQIFAEVRLQKKSIRIVLLKVDYSDFINDVKIIPPSNGWGNKTIKIYVNDKENLNRMMPLIKRSYYSIK